MPSNSEHIGLRTLSTKLLYETSQFMTSTVPLASKIPLPSRVFGKVNLSFSKLEVSLGHWSAAWELRDSSICTYYFCIVLRSIGVVTALDLCVRRARMRVSAPCHRGPLGFAVSRASLTHSTAVHHCAWRHRCRPSQRTCWRPYQLSIQPTSRLTIQASQPKFYPLLRRWRPSPANDVTHI